MRFTRSLYRKANRHYIARAQELHSISKLTTFDPWGSAIENNDAFWDALTMAGKIALRGQREHGLFGGNNL